MTAHLYTSMPASGSQLREFHKRWWSLLLLTAVLVVVSLWPPYKNSPPIRSDGFGYHIWTRAILEHDFRFCQWSKELTANGRFTLVDAARGVCQIPYPPGLALLRFPIMAPLVDRRPSAPLVSEAEEQASLWCGAFALWIVAWCALRSLQLLAVPAWAAHASVLMIVFGTGLFHYATYDGSFTHVYSAVLFALVLWVWIRSQAMGSRLLWVALLALSFYLASIRITNLFLLAVLALAHVFWSLRGRRQSQKWLELWSVAAGSACALAIQLTYNHYATGHLQLSSYGNEGFLFDRPMQWQVLFSYERGLFTYYPVAGLALLAGLLAGRTRRAALLALSLVLVFAGIYGFWDRWDLGSGFGHRGFVELVPIFILILATALPELPRKLRGMVLAAAILSTLATTELMLGYWRGSLPVEHTTRKTYWLNILDARWLP